MRFRQLFELLSTGTYLPRCEETLQRRWHIRKEDKGLLAMMVKVVPAKPIAGSGDSGLTESIRTSLTWKAYTALPCHLESKKPSSEDWAWAKYLIPLGWPTGLEPATTGITILDSTN
jgi:hypothetical protein